MKKLKAYLPNQSENLALVSLDDERPFRAYWPIKFSQIIGGRTWSISFTRFQTTEPVLIQKEERW